MKRLVVTDVVLYDEAGNYLGKEVVERETFTADELWSHLCTECGAANGHHKSYFVKTGQDGFGTVNGYTQNCSRGGRTPEFGQVVKGQ